jgi:hypothetical protein
VLGVEALGIAYILQKRRKSKTEPQSQSSETQPDPEPVEVFAGFTEGEEPKQSIPKKKGKQ